MVNNNTNSECQINKYISNQFTQMIRYCRSVSYIIDHDINQIYSFYSYSENWFAQKLQIFKLLSFDLIGESDLEQSDF